MAASYVGYILHCTDMGAIICMHALISPYAPIPHAHVRTEYSKPHAADRALLCADYLKSFRQILTKLMEVDHLILNYTRCKFHDNVRSICRERGVLPIHGHQSQPTGPPAQTDI